MTFVHEDPEFTSLLASVGQAHGLDEPLVEKDYWITHTLWALENAGLDLWFKGGTSLSKGFSIIQRFSEDLDMKIEAGSTALPQVSKWKAGGKTGGSDRLAFYVGLANLALPGIRQTLDEASLGKAAEGANLKIHYPGIFLNDLPGEISPFVLLEAGEARVRPCLKPPISSMVHDHLDRLGIQEQFTRNRPRRLNCIHPKVTLIEKLDAISRRFPRADLDAVKFVRHYEDAAHIIRGQDALPPMDGFADIEALVLDMLCQGQIRRNPHPENASFNPDGSDRWNEIRHAHRSIQRLFWGPRLSLEEATADIRAFLGGLGQREG